MDNVSIIGLDYASAEIACGITSVDAGRDDAQQLLRGFGDIGRSRTKITTFVTKPSVRTAA